MILLVVGVVAGGSGRGRRQRARSCRQGFNQSTITKLISVPVPKPRRPGSVEPKRPEPLAGVGAVEPKRPAPLAGAGAMEPKRPGAGSVEPKVSCILLEEGVSEFFIFRSF